jgi:beta-xylosidase
MKLPHYLLGFGFLAYGMAAQTAGPISKRFNADPSPHVFGNTVYLYATDDASNSGTYWDSTEWRAYSSKDLEHWVDEGSFLNVEVFKWADKDAKAWAPEMAERDGRYYFYAPVGGDTIGVAVSDKPLGPFKDAIGAPLVDKATDDNAGDEPIDPAVYIDQEGQAYLYFGTRVPKVVKLNPDMTSLAGPIRDVEILGFPADDGEKTYGEAPYLHRDHEQYYFTFSTGWPGQIVYATGSSPLGPFTYQGVILDYLDISTNHQAILKFKGKNWFFYHDNLLEGGGSQRRSITLSPLEYGDNGEILPIESR